MTNSYEDLKFVFDERIISKHKSCDYWYNISDEKLEKYPSNIGYYFRNSETHFERKICGARKSSTSSIYCILHPEHLGSHRGHLLYPNQLSETKAHYGCRIFVSYNSKYSYLTTFPNKNPVQLSLFHDLYPVFKYIRTRNY